MNTYANISSELRTYFSGHQVFRILLPLDRVFLFGGVGLLALNRFVSIGGLLYSLAYYGFFLGLLLAYANFKQKELWIGMFIYAGIKLYPVLRYGIFSRNRFIDFHSLITCLIFAGLGYLIFKGDSISGVSNDKAM